LKPFQNAIFKRTTEKASSEGCLSQKIDAPYIIIVVKKSEYTILHETILCANGTAYTASTNNMQQQTLSSSM